MLWKNLFDRLNFKMNDFLNLLKKYRLFLIIFSILIGFYNAFRVSWVCDDAYISFIYARNLYEGKGLVFQEGERVEGYSNFLWTVLMSLSFPFKIQVEDFAIFWGICFYILTLIVFQNPLLMLSYSLFSFGWEFATGGLETSLFTFLITVSYRFWKGKDWSKLLFVSSVLPLVRPDGILFSFGNVSLLILYQKSKVLKLEFWKEIPPSYWVLIFTCVSLLIGKFCYYGDILPNTYYAKADMGAYWSQGILYFKFFWKEFPAFSIFLIVGTVLSASPYSWIVFFYLLYVLYIGGDFMFARFLIPVIPVMTELTWERLQQAREVWTERLSKKGETFSLIILLVFLLSPLYQTGSFTENALEIWKQYGISHERKLYKNLGKGIYTYDEIILNEFRVAFAGSQAHFIYYMRPMLAIEAMAGLTDSVIAKTKPKSRGLIGHEKKAPLEYLIQRGVEIVMMDMYEELKNPGRNLYYEWNGNRLLWKVLTLDEVKLEILKEHPSFDTSNLKPELWQKSISTD